MNTISLRKCFLPFCLWSFEEEAVLHRDICRLRVKIELFARAYGTHSVFRRRTPPDQATVRQLALARVPSVNVAMLADMSGRFPQQQQYDTSSWGAGVWDAFQRLIDGPATKHRTSEDDVVALMQRLMRSEFKSDGTVLCGERRERQTDSDTVTIILEVLNCIRVTYRSLSGSSLPDVWNNQTPRMMSSGEIAVHDHPEGLFFKALQCVVLVRCVSLAALEQERTQLLRHDVTGLFAVGMATARRRYTTTDPSISLQLSHNALHFPRTAFQHSSVSKKKNLTNISVSDYGTGGAKPEQTRVETDVKPVASMMSDPVRAAAVLKREWDSLIGLPRAPLSSPEGNRSLSMADLRDTPHVLQPTSKKSASRVHVTDPFAQKGHVLSMGGPAPTAREFVLLREQLQRVDDGSSEDTERDSGVPMEQTRQTFQNLEHHAHNISHLLESMAQRRARGSEQQAPSVSDSSQQLRRRLVLSTPSAKPRQSVAKSKRKAGRSRGAMTKNKTTRDNGWSDAFMAASAQAEQDMAVLKESARSLRNSTSRSRAPVVHPSRVRRSRSHVSRQSRRSLKTPVGSLRHPYLHRSPSPGLATSTRSPSNKVANWAG